MANEVYSSYRFSGENLDALKEKFNGLGDRSTSEEIIEYFGLSQEPDRWFIDGPVDIDEIDIVVTVWSAWYPKEEPWEEIADKYNVELTYLSENECPLWFLTNGEDGYSYRLFYDFEGDFWDNYGTAQWETFGTLDEVKQFIADWELDNWMIIFSTWYDEWYDEELLKEEYSLTPEDDI